MPEVRHKDHHNRARQRPQAGHRGHRPKDEALRVRKRGGVASGERRELLWPLACRVAYATLGATQGVRLRVDYPGHGVDRERCDEKEHGCQLVHAGRVVRRPGEEEDRCRREDHTRDGGGHQAAQSADAAIHVKGTPSVASARQYDAEVHKHERRDAHCEVGRPPTPDAKVPLYVLGLCGVVTESAAQQVLRMWIVLGCCRRARAP
mmetsp:Transcript_5915/g.11694  ORF Transcript_5915/g.11694 Transcript_5915/m.11694 type:complete len:206 (-) Transcript_5915:23-640(-)